MATQDVQGIRAQLLADPQFQELLARVNQIGQQFQATPNVNGQRAPLFQQGLLAQQAARDYAAAHGMPQGYTWNFNNNQIEQESFANRHPYLTALGLGGAAVAAPLAFGLIGTGAGGAAVTPAAGGPAAGGAGASGVGIGETAAVTGLGGSGFGGTTGPGGFQAPMYDANGNVIPTPPPLGSRQTTPNTSSGLPGSHSPGVPGLGGLGDVLKKLALGLAPLGGFAASRAFGPSQPQAPQVPPELTQLLQMAVKRMADQQPLADRVNAGELAGLPRLS